MHPEIARNQNYYDHYANDSKYIHSALLPLDDDGTRRTRTRFTPAYSLLSPTPISPIAAPSEEQKEHEDNKNEVHIFLQDNLAGAFPPAYVDAEFYSPASDSTYAPAQLAAVQPSLRPGVVVGNDGGLQVAVEDQGDEMSITSAMAPGSVASDKAYRMPWTSSGRSRRESGTA
jgi:hypothetical protein